MLRTSAPELRGRCGVTRRAATWSGSYQVVLLQPYARNLTSATVKSPKLYWWTSACCATGPAPLTGPLFETLVVSEARKFDTVGRDVSLWFYRTRSGREVDLLITTPAE